MAEDFNRMDCIAEGNALGYQTAELTVDPRAIAGTRFSLGNAYCKAILCLLTYNQPKTFDSSSIVVLDNSNLKIATSRNYHHFFPKKYLEECQKDKQPNLIANITLIDALSNIRIGKTRPSEYIARFAKDNKSLPETLQTHLIHDIGDYGITSDDYDTFIERRAKSIALALNVKLLSITPAQAAEAEKNPE